MTSTSRHRLQPPHLHLPSRPAPAHPTLPQRRTSGGIMDHVNASEATRLESHCCGSHGQQALFTSHPHSPPPPPPPLKSYRHSCDAALSLPLDVTLGEKKRKMKRSERGREDSRRARAYFGYSATIKMRHPLTHEFTSGEKLVFMRL